MASPTPGSSDSFLTVIIPSHNGILTLTDALNSLLSQTLKVDEIIVVDDGSMDGSPQMVSEHFPNVNLIELPTNHGVGFARNVGAAAASSQFIAFLDQDDMWLPMRCERMKHISVTHPDWDAWVTGAQVFTTEDQRLSQHPFGAWVEHWLDPNELQSAVSTIEPGPADDTDAVIPVKRLLNWTVSVTTSYVIRRLTFQAIGGCAPWLRSADDWVMLQNLAAHSMVHELQDKSMLYRVHGANTSLETEWGLPLLLATAAARHGGAMVPSHMARDEAVVGRLSESEFLMNLLRNVVGSDRAGSARDAASMVLLLGTDAKDKREVFRKLARAKAKALVSRARARSSGRTQA